MKKKLFAFFMLLAFALSMIPMTAAADQITAPTVAATKAKKTAKAKTKTKSKTKKSVKKKPAAKKAAKKTVKKPQTIGTPKTVKKPTVQKKQVAPKKKTTAKKKTSKKKAALKPKSSTSKEIQNEVSQDLKEMAADLSDLNDRNEISPEMKTELNRGLDDALKAAANGSATIRQTGTDSNKGIIQTVISFIKKVLGF